MIFEFLRARFRFRAAESLFFAPGQSANILRGAFGTIFRGLACAPECRGRAASRHSDGCAYARIFEPGCVTGQSPSGLADWPRPFVFRAAHLDGRVIAPGEPFFFDVHLFDRKQPSLGHFILAFGEFARQGLGPRRGRAELTTVELLALDGSVSREVYTAGEALGPPMESLEPCGPWEAVRLDLSGPALAISRVRVHFLTPTELKGGSKSASAPAFAVLFNRLRDRVSTLRALYGAGPLEIDFRGLGRRAAEIQLLRSDLRQVKAERRSSRTGQVHPLGGFTGEVEYGGDLGEFLPYLEAGRWIGVGRQTVWGKGEIHVTLG